MFKTANETTAGAFKLTRLFNAPRELVYKAWTEAERLEQWWGPAGMKLEVAALDVRPHGKFLYSMQMPNNQKMWGRFVYSEVMPPEQISYTNSFSDAEGNIIRAPFSKTWPLEIYNKLTLKQVDGKTELTLQSLPINATAEEQQTFEEGLSALQQGFTGTLNQLEEYLQRITN